MTTKTTGRKAPTKTASKPATSKANAPRATAAKKPTTTAARTVSPAASLKRRSAKTISPVISQVRADAHSTSKQTRLIALLNTLPGATIDQMMTLTGWQAHTVRGTISGVLRKRLGLSVNCAPSDTGASVYRIIGSVASA